jgi:hypothetical protein
MAKKRNQTSTKQKPCIFIESPSYSIYQCRI